MKTLDLEQGSPEWHAHRANHLNASDASAMMGVSPYVSRSELIKRMATGIAPEIDDATQRRFDHGHAVEPLGRAMAEEIIGQELYPVTGVHDDGRLSASFDGLTMDESIAFECKQWNAAKVDHMKMTGAVPAEDYWQCVHQMHVCAADKLLYMVTDGDRKATVWMERDRKAESNLLSGWAQLQADLSAYVPTAPAEVVIADSTESLPAVSVRMDGSIAVISNLELFGAKLTEFVSGIDKKPETDQAFANCEAAVKTLKKAEEALEQAEAAALAQIDPVEAMRRAVANYRDLARTTRLQVEKIVKNRKDEIRTEIVQAARGAWNEHANRLNARLKRVSISIPPPDFAAAIKGKKTVTSLRDAVDTLLAQSKIAANQEADDLAEKIAAIDELSAGFEFLVRDVAELVRASKDHLAGVIKGRIAEHEAKEAARLEAERAKIRAEEEARARRDAEAKAEEERQKIREEEQAKARAEAEERRRVEAHASQQRAEATLETMPGQARPVTAPAAAVALPEQARVAADRPGAKRPTDSQIIAVLALHYRVHESTVITWLFDMDLESASREMEKEFV